MVFAVLGDMKRISGFLFWLLALCEGRYVLKWPSFSTLPQSPTAKWEPEAAHSSSHNTSEGHLPPLPALQSLASSCESCPCASHPDPGPQANPPQSSSHRLRSWIPTPISSSGHASSARPSHSHLQCPSAQSGTGHFLLPWALNDHARSISTGLKALVVQGDLHGIKAEFVVWGN